MRLLHVTPFYEPAPGHGGMARAASSLCRALAGRGHDVVVATALLDPGDVRREQRGGVEVHRLPGPAWLARRLVPWAPGFARFLEDALQAIDAVHLHGHRSGFALTAARAASRAGVPYVWQPHGTFPDHRQHPWLKAVYDRLAGDGIVRGASATLAVSEAEALDLPGRPQVVPNGVEALASPDALTPSAALSPGEVPAPRTRSDAPLLFVGSDARQKRGLLLTELLAALPRVRLRMAGRFGPRFVRSFAPFGGRVTWSGVLDDAALATAYGDASLVVHPAVGEAFGLVPFEAALRGTAAVVAAGHGCGEWFGRAGGCLVPPDDAAALAEAVRRRLQDPGLAAAESQAVAAFANGLLTWERAAQAVERVYQGLAGLRRRRGAA